MCAALTQIRGPDGRRQPSGEGPVLKRPVPSHQPLVSRNVQGPKRISYDLESDILTVRSRCPMMWVPDGVGARPQVVKARPVSDVRRTGGFEDTVIHTVQHAPDGAGPATEHIASAIVSLAS